MGMIGDNFLVVYTKVNKIFPFSIFYKMLNLNVYKYEYN